MSGMDRRQVWIKLIMVLGVVALGIIGIFTVANTVGGSSNACAGAVCGDSNTDNQVVVPTPSPTR
ncbi:hypothetical protein [Streptomyces sp. NPDC002994]|uniref:hypothetical protein n=1 Tax=Streptomyces sp. NPDC002994 TaxID=3154441 RepID=UPI0033B1C6A9